MLIFFCSLRNKKMHKVLDYLYLSYQPFIKKTACKKWMCNFKLKELKKLLNINLSIMVPFFKIVLWFHRIEWRLNSTDPDLSYLFIRHFFPIWQHNFNLLSRNVPDLIKVEIKWTNFTKKLFEHFSINYISNQN